jgi:hypothetical protein
VSRTAAQRSVEWLVPGTIALGLLLDTRGPAWGQAMASVLAWLALGWVLRVSHRVEQRRLVLCVLISTLGEAFLSLGWGLYEYRLGGIPLFVPPGHALLFAWGVRAARTAPRWLPWSTLALVGPLGALGALSGSDTEGLPWFLALGGFLAWGRRRRLYATMFLLATTLELAGTWLGAWWWHPQVPWLGLTSWNPPLCAGVFYCVLDVLVLQAGRPLSALVRRGRARLAPEGPRGMSRARK